MAYLKFLRQYELDQVHRVWSQRTPAPRLRNNLILITKRYS